MDRVSPRIGRYALYDEIASGGMAVVHLGRLRGPAGFSRTVAVKRVRAQFTEGGELAAALLDEGRVSARIQHPFVVQTLDVVSADGELAIVMEYVHGVSLSTLVKRARARGARMPPRMAATIVAQVLRGLHAAHEVTDEAGQPLHLVHRDVSPQNVLVGLDGIARVLDFGIAKAFGRTNTTREGELKGKLAYMAPEQASQLPLDRRTDVFAASIVLWELLTDERLFAGDEAKATFANVMRCEVPSPRSHNAAVDETLDAIVLRGLARDPEERYATAADMAQALEDWAPPMTAAQVGEWVAAWCGEELAQRRARITDIERGAADAVGASSSSSEDATATGEGSLSTAGLVSAPSLSAPSPKRRRLAVGALLLVLSGATFFAVRMARAPVAAVASPPIATASSTPIPPAPEPSAEAVAPPETTAPAPPPAPSSSGATRPLGNAAKRRPSAPNASPSARTGPDCSDPYVFDAQGKRRYRRECLTP